MRKLVLVVFLIIAVTFSAVAADANGEDLGVGVNLGSPTSITAKYDLDQEMAVVGGLGFGGGLTVYGGVQYNFMDFSIEKLDFNVYAGGNAYVTLGTFDLGLQIPIGVCYYFDDPAIEVFLEVGPSFSFINFSAGAVGGIGARYELEMK